MKKIYKQLWDEAKPYYEKGRPMDVDHIKWMMGVVEDVCKHDRLDESLLMPLAILHDVGYATIVNPKTVNHLNKNIRRAHMKAGSEIAAKILKSVGFPVGKSKKIVEYIKVHDNWAFGEVDMYVRDKTLGCFKDLDYLWKYTEKGCAADKKLLKKSDSEMLQILKDEVSPIYGKKPFSTLYIKRLREEYLRKREAELKNENAG